MNKRSTKIEESKWIVTELRGVEYPESEEYELWPCVQRVWHGLGETGWKDDILPGLLNHG